MQRLLSIGLTTLAATAAAQLLAADKPELTPPSIIRTNHSDYGWRVAELSQKTAGQGLIREYNCLFTIPDYWPYGHFSSKDYCQLPGKLLRVRADGKPGGQHHFLSPAEFAAQHVIPQRSEGSRPKIARDSSLRSG